jgi:hypothetical protein
MVVKSKHSDTGKHPRNVTSASLSNLTPWHKGQSGNDSGRLPKGSVSITKEIKRQLELHPRQVVQLAGTIIKKGIAGDMNALTTILERIDGKVTDHVQMDVRPIALEFVPAESLLLTTTTTIVDQPSQLQIQSSTQGTEQTGSE